MKSKFIVALTVGLVSTVLFIGLLYTGVLSSVEWRMDDALTRLVAKPGEATDDVVLILLDQVSLDWAEENMQAPWPWPREMYAMINDFVARGGAKAVGYDVIYSEESFYGPWDDETYALSLEGSGNGVGTVFLSGDYGEEHWPSNYPYPPSDSIIPDNPLGPGMPPLLPFAQFSIPEIGDYYAELANVQTISDKDGVFRRVPPAMFFDGMAIPSMALAMYRVGGTGTGVLEWKGSRSYLDGRRLKTDRNGNLTLRFRGPSATHPTYNAAELLRSELQIYEGVEPQLNPELFRDKFVFFGFSAPGLKDLRPSPVDTSYTGVEIHATMLDNLLSGDFLLSVPGTNTLWMVLMVCLFLALTIPASLSIQQVWGWRKSAAIFIAFIAASVILPVLPWFFGVDLPVVPAIGATLSSLVAAFIVSLNTEGAKRRFISNAFGQYVSREVVSQLQKNPDRLKLGGERRDITIFFSDLQGFTTISEGLEPEELTALLNEYLTAMSKIVMSEGGTIDKFEGDAIIAFWNAPLDLEDHAARGVRAALECQRVLTELRPALKLKAGGKELLMRIGMNTGPAVVGNMGSTDRFDYTMLGDAVNLAARLEGVNKQFGTYTMVSRATLDFARRTGIEFPVRELARVEVVGKSEPVTVYEPLTPEEWDNGVDLWHEFEEALELFYEGSFARAREAFGRLADKDPASAHYLAKLDEMGNQAPPGWKGVWVMTSK